MENFHKYTKIKVFGHEENKDIFANKEDEIIIEEKIDGANFRFIVHRGKVIFGSRTQQITSNEGEETNVSKSFKKCLSFVRNRIESRDKKFLKTIEGLIFYGECCVKHTMSYDWDKIPPFLGFDIYDQGRFLGYDIKKCIFESLNLEIVPLIYRGTFEDEVSEKIVPISKYAPKENPEQLAEGVVFKNYSNQIFAKFVRDEFKEKNAIAFGGNPKYNKEDNNDNNVLIFKYCTNARIEKNIFKLIDEGNKLELPLMKLLPNRVYDDIIEEEWKEILYSKWVIDFSKLRKKMTKRCLAVLQQVININKE